MRGMVKEVEASEQPLQNQTVGAVNVEDQNTGRTSGQRGPADSAPTQHTRNNSKDGNRKPGGASVHASPMNTNERTPAN